MVFITNERERKIGVGAAPDGCVEICIESGGEELYIILSPKDAITLVDNIIDAYMGKEKGV